MQQIFYARVSHGIHGWTYPVPRFSGIPDWLPSNASTRVLVDGGQITDNANVSCVTEITAGHLR